MTKAEYMTFKQAIKEIDGLLISGYNKDGEQVHIAGNAWWIQYLRNTANGNVITVEWNTQRGLYIVTKNNKIIKEWKYEKMY